MDEAVGEVGVDNDRRRHLCQLQQALLDGRIDQTVYDGLKRDFLRASVDSPQAAAPLARNEPGLDRNRFWWPTGLVALAIIALVTARQTFSGSSVAEPQASVLGPAGPATTPAPPVEPVILLVPGMAFDLAAPCDIWGKRASGTSSARWTGTIGALEDKGFRFGGFIEAAIGNVRLPECLDHRGTAGDPRSARLFVLKFSRSAATDGLAFKSLELAMCLKELRQYTRARKVKIVAHSAGGIVARTYIQNSLPGVPYADDVHSLITIATPHLGSDLAAHFGDFLGTRATVLGPSTGLIRQLNDNSLPLPDNVRFACVIVRGFGGDITGTGDKYDALIDQEFVGGLPFDFLNGGDQIVHVKSQNLALSRCARDYEARTGRPVQYMLVRVTDPSPEDSSLNELKVHAVAPYDDAVQSLVAMLLQDDRCWSSGYLTSDPNWMGLQAQLTCLGLLEAKTRSLHPWSEVLAVDIERCEQLGCEGNRFEYAFSGKTTSTGKLVGIFSRDTILSGNMQLQFDSFGRIRGSGWRVEGHDKPCD